MNCSFTKTGAVSRKSTGRQSNAARKSRRRKLAAAAETALRNGEEPSNAPVVQATDKERRLDSEYGLNLNSIDHEQDISNSNTVRPSDLHCLENQQSEQQSAAPEAESEVKSFCLL